MPAKDFLGNTISIGDLVIFMKLNYRELAKGTITKITSHTVVIDTDDKYHHEVRQNHNQVIVQRRTHEEASSGPDATNAGAGL